MIKRIKLEGVGHFKSPCTIDFKPGLNVVYGRNEAGKSTLIRAVEVALFGFKPIKDWKYAGWESAEAVVEAVVAESHEIEAHVVRKYSSKIRGSVQRAHVAETIGNQPLWEDRIDIELFKSMFAMGTDELNNIGKKSWKELNASLTDNYNSEVFKTASETVSDLESMASVLYRENGRGQYEFKHIREEQKTYEDQLRALQIEHAYAIKSEGEKQHLLSALKETDQSLVDLDLRLRQIEGQREQHRLDKEWQQLVTDLEAVRVLNLPERTALERFKHNAERRMELVFQKQKWVAQRMQSDSGIEQALLEKSSKTVGRSMKRIALAALLVGVTGAVAWWAWPEGYSQYEQWGLGVLVLLSIAFTANIRLAASKARRELANRLESQVAELKARLQMEQTQIDACTEEMATLMDQDGPIEEWLASQEGLDLESALAWRIRQDYLEKRLDELKASSGKRSLSVENSMGSLEVSEHLLMDLLEKRDEASARKLELEKQLAHKTNLSVKEIEYQLNELEKKLGMKNQELWAMANQRDRLLVASKIVAAAEQLYRQSQRPDFLIKASRFMKVLTSGKYEEILMTDAGGFVLRQGSLLVPVGETTSRGTREQMYMALKIALMSRLDPLGRYPLMLDEVAVNFDSERRKGLYKMLEEIGENRQIIMTTCHEWLLDELDQHLNYEKVALAQMGGDCS